MKLDFRSMGPALIVAAVVCGPGSILTSSKTGAQFGYRAAWVLVVACVLMIGMVALATRLGLVCRNTPCGELAIRFGRTIAALIGIIMFLIVACFQSSNNVAVIASLETFGIDTGVSGSVFVLVGINLIVIAFLYFSRHLYTYIERAMKLLVLLMVVAFLINFVAARPSVSGMAQGLVPSLPDTDSWVLVALVGTTFSVAAAFYQAYLVREKGWNKTDRKIGWVDSVTGVVTLGAISLVIMFTSAAVFYGAEKTVTLDSPQAVALQLRPLFGVWAQVIFGIGIFAGAISSFLVNALIGGHIMSDGFGLGDRIESPWTIHLTTLALLLGMVVAAVSVSTGISRVQLIVLAQALTVVGVPALALTLLYLGIVKRRQDPSAIPRPILWLAAAGLAVTCLLASRTAINVIQSFSTT